MACPAPYFTDGSVTLHHGDSLAVLRELPDDSVNCCVTSPPYFGLRDYGVEGQYGLEASPAEYVETMRALFAEVRRVLADDGTLWLNVGDSYAGARGGPRGTTSQMASGARSVADKQTSARYFGLPPKNLIGIPWLTAFALQADDWILRNEIIWSKSNAMPESVDDRLSGRHEHLFLMAKSSRYWFDLDPIREPHTSAERFAHREPNLAPHKWLPAEPAAVTNNNRSGGDGVGFADAGRNPGDVWTVATQPFSAAHFAVMPQALAERAILAGCKPGGTVLDPFSGSGTTGLAATKHGRKYVGIDLNAEYLDLSLRTRFAQPGLDFTSEETA